MPNRKLTVIPEPEPDSRSVLIQPPSDNPFPFFTGSGDTNLLCGDCDTVLAAAISADTISNVVLKCAACGSYNDTESPHAFTGWDITGASKGNGSPKR